MKRDADEIRRILSQMEASPFNHFKAKLALNGVLERGTDTERGKANQIEAEHIRWMLDEGLLAQVFGSDLHVRVTAKGCNFLDAVRDDGVWAKTKNAVAETGGNASIEIVKSLAVGLLKKKISQHTGIDL